MMGEFICDWDLTFEAWLLWGFACYGIGLITMGTLMLFARTQPQGK